VDGLGTTDSTPLLRNGRRTFAGLFQDDSFALLGLGADAITGSFCMLGGAVNARYVVLAP
jgi:hypothetical protein